MSRATIILGSDASREKAAHWARGCPRGTRVEFKEPKRSLPQNDKMWASLTDVAQQVEWHGLKLSADDRKLIMLDGLNKECRVVPNIDGDGFVQLRRSSDLSKSEMSDLIELIHAFGAKHGVTFNDT